MRGVISVWSGWRALVCPVGDTFSTARIGMLVAPDDKKKICREQGIME